MKQNHHYVEQLYVHVCSIVLAALLLQILMMAERLLEFGSL